MRNAKGGAGSTRSGNQNDGRHSIVSDLVSLIEHVQASMALIETAIATEASPGSQQAAAGIIVLDDVTPRYQSASAMSASDRRSAPAFSGRYFSCELSIGRMKPGRRIPVVVLTRLARPPIGNRPSVARRDVVKGRSQAPMRASCFDAEPFFFLFLPFRNETSISVPLTRTSSQRR
jgi:hypothetical protein